MIGTDYWCLFCDLRGAGGKVCYMFGSSAIMEKKKNVNGNHTDTKLPSTVGKMCDSEIDWKDEKQNRKEKSVNSEEGGAVLIRCLL